MNWWVVERGRSASNRPIKHAVTIGENYSKQKRKKRKNLFNSVPKTSIFDFDALGMTVVVLDSNWEREILRNGDFEEADWGWKGESAEMSSNEEEKDWERECIERPERMNWKRRRARMSSERRNRTVWENESGRED